MLNFFAPINTLGYGVFSHGLIRAYDRHVSREIALHPVPQVEMVNEDIQRWISNGSRFDRNDPSIMIFQAPWLNRFSGKPMMGFPIFELDVVPDYDLAIMKQLDVMLQPSEWGKKVLEAHGLKKVFVVPGGYDPGEYSPRGSLEEKLGRINRQGVTFVHVGKFEVRKSSEELLHCFVRAACKGTARANLIFHVCNPFDTQWLEKVRAILVSYGFVSSGPQFVRGHVRITVPEGRMQADPKKLYHAADFGLWASKAEGWNLPLLECIACGIPTLTTRNTAQADFVREGIYPGELVIASHQKEPTRAGGNFWPLDHEEVIQKISRMIQNPEPFLRMGGKCLESVQPFTWENAALRLQSVLREVGHA